MNVRGILRTAVGISIALFWFSMEPCAAQEEIKLTKSITMLPDRPSGIQMITKFWNEEHTQNSHFVLTFLTSAELPAVRSYLERVQGFAAEKPVDFTLWEGADCSFFQTLVFRVRTKNGPRLVVGRAARTGEAFVNGQLVKSLGDPSEQRIQIFVPKRSETDDPGKSTLWLDPVAEIVTKQKLCTVEEVRQAIRAFVREHMATLTSQQ